MWQIPNDYYYLINDSGSTITEAYTKDYSFAQNPVVNLAGNGLYYYNKTGTYELGMGILGYDYMTHNYSTNVDYMNLFMSEYDSGSNCTKMGPGWRHVRRSETSASDPVNGVPAYPAATYTWTATPDSATTDSFWAWNNTNAEISTSASSYTYYHVVCVRETAP